jgi:hypothetical protein
MPPVYVIETAEGKPLAQPAFVVASKPRQAVSRYAETQVQARLATPMEALNARDSGAVIITAPDDEEPAAPASTDPHAQKAVAQIADRPAGSGAILPPYGVLVPGHYETTGLGQA